MEELIKKYQDYAKENGFHLNPDEKVVEVIARGLLGRKELFGQFYCPCRRLTGNLEEDKKIICPCIYHKDEIQKEGFCHCKLFAR